MWPSLTFQLAVIAEGSIELADPVFQARFGLRIHELRLLRLIDDESCTTLAEVAAQSKIDRSELAIIVARLMKGGYIELDASTLKTTSKAKAIRQDADPLTLEMEDLLLSVLDPNQRKAFEDSVVALANWVRTGIRNEVLKRYPEHQ